MEGKSNERALFEPPFNSSKRYAFQNFFKAAGCEVLEVVYGEIASEQKQIMNQADYFYYSGHGFHKFANIDDFEPADVAGFWRKDLDCVIISGCAVLDSG